MRIGLDFDNTIVCYDKAIRLLADELLELPDELDRSKRSLRDYLRAQGRETEWTAFQGELYSRGMGYAQPFEGAVATMQQLVGEGHQLVIISHRSRRPYVGPPYDLHGAARGWVADHLQREGLFGGIGDEANVYFLETLDQKLMMIKHLGCDVFMDDLTEVLTAPEFPDCTKAILFDPATNEISHYQSNNIDSVINCWTQLGLHRVCR